VIGGMALAWHSITARWPHPGIITTRDCGSSRWKRAASDGGARRSAVPQTMSTGIVTRWSLPSMMSRRVNIVRIDARRIHDSPIAWRRKSRTTKSGSLASASLCSQSRCRAWSIVVGAKAASSSGVGKSRPALSISTRRCTRSGCSAARRRAIQPPMETPATPARPRCTASMNPRTSSVSAAME